MADLLIRIKRARDGSAALTCVRDDGSVTWQRQLGSLGAVFPPHDLTHFAVETALGYRRGFYGLIAEGWDIGDFASPWPRGVIPAEARQVELLVGLFETASRAGQAWSAAEFQEQGAIYCSVRQDVVMPALTDEDVDRVRVVRAEVLARWAETLPGATLELTFVSK